MKTFEKGVSYYTYGALTITFPEDETVCYYCPLCSGEYTLHRAKCLRTGEIIPSPETMRGAQCPIKFDNEILGGYENGNV